ncbi:MAG: bacteriohemerythrin [Rhodocyclaceae bacterium]
MVNRLVWDERYRVGNEALDAQHEGLFELCNALADCLDGDDGTDARRFDQLYAELKECARRHFATEEALLAASGYPGLDDLRSEYEEFDYLSGEIATRENFARSELQTFLALWWAGHVTGAARNFPAWLTGGA